MLDFDSYQRQAKTTAQYGGSGEYLGLAYTTMGLVGEAGEIANAVKKIHRDCNGEISEEHKKYLCKELGDVQWYAAMLADELGVNLSAIAQANLEKLSSRKARGVISGSGDNR